MRLNWKYDLKLPLEDLIESISRSWNLSYSSSDWTLNWCRNKFFWFINIEVGMKYAAKMNENKNIYDILQVSAMAKNYRRSYMNCYFRFNRKYLINKKLCIRCILCPCTHVPNFSIIAFFLQTIFSWLYNPFQPYIMDWKKIIQYNFALFNFCAMSKDNHKIAEL